MKILFLLHALLKEIQECLQNICLWYQKGFPRVRTARSGRLVRRSHVPAPPTIFSTRGSISAVPEAGQFGDLRNWHDGALWNRVPA
jgi:hypothetical protein